MVNPKFQLTGPEARHLLVGLQLASEEQLAANPQWPSMRQAVLDGKLIYREADPQEHWQTYRELVAQLEANGVAYGDCEDLATAIAAEDRVRYGVQSKTFTYNPSPGLFHVVVSVPQGDAARFGGSGTWPGARLAPPVSGRVLQDPSARAGMSGGSFGSLGKQVSPARAGQQEYGAMSSSQTAFNTPVSVFPISRGDRVVLGEIAAAAGESLGVIFHGSKIAADLYSLDSNQGTSLLITQDDLDNYTSQGMAAIDLDQLTPAVASFGGLFVGAGDSYGFSNAGLTKRVGKRPSSRRSSGGRKRKPSVRSVASKASSSSKRKQRKSKSSSGQGGQQGRPSGYRTASETMLPMCSPEPLEGMLPFYDENGDVIYCYPQEDFIEEDYAVAEALDYYGLIDEEELEIDAAYGTLRETARTILNPMSTILEDLNAPTGVRAILDPASGLSDWAYDHGQDYFQRRRAEASAADDEYGSLRETARSILNPMSTILESVNAPTGVKAILDPASGLTDWAVEKGQGKQIEKWTANAWGARNAGDEDAARGYVAKIEKKMASMQKAGTPYTPDDSTRKLLTWFRGGDASAAPQRHPSGRPLKPGQPAPRGPRPPNYPANRPWPPQGGPPPGWTPQRGQQGRPGQQNRPGQQPPPRGGYRQQAQRPPQSGRPGQHRQVPPGQRPPQGGYNRPAPGRSMSGDYEPSMLSASPAAMYGAMHDVKLFDDESSW